MERKTYKNFIKEVYDLVKNEYTVLGEYLNDSTKIVIRHNKCNKSFLISPSHFLQDSRCPYCFGKILND